MTEVPQAPRLLEAVGKSALDAAWTVLTDRFGAGHFTVDHAVALSAGLTAGAAMAALIVPGDRITPEAGPRLGSPGVVGRGEAKVIRVRKRPLLVEAMLWLGPPVVFSRGEKAGAASVADLQAWGAVVEPTGAWSQDENPDQYTLLVWNEPEGQRIRCPVGYYIIRGVKGEFYPCAPDIFEMTYEVIPGTSCDASPWADNVRPFDPVRG